MSVVEIQIKCSEPVVCIVCGGVFDGWATACGCIVEAVGDCVEGKDARDMRQKGAVDV